MNIENLENKIIEFDTGVNCKKGKVVLIDSSIGITIVNNDNPNDYLLCLILPSSPKWENHFDLEFSNDIFKAICKQIKKGVIDYEAISAIREAHNKFNGIFGNSSPTFADCPF